MEVTYRLHMSGEKVLECYSAVYLSPVLLIKVLLFLENISNSRAGRLV